MTLVDNELSNRELEILRMVATGASNKEIATCLFISANTVKVHLRNIFNKIGVSSRTEAAMYAVNAGIVSAIDQENQKRKPEFEQAGKSTKLESLSQSKRSPRWFNIVGWSAGFLVTIILFVSVVYIWRQWRNQHSTQPLLPDESQRWQELANMPTARYGLAVAVVESNIFAIAGMTAEGVTNVVERYDTVIDTWMFAEDKPTAVYEAGAIAVGGRIYVPGGKLASGEPTDVLEIYDPSLDQWKQGASMPLALSAYALTGLEGRLYLFGGWDGRNYLDKVYRYDPRIDSWQEMTPLPSPRGYCSATVAGGKIYVIGGFDGRRILRANDIYQPDLDHDSSNPWSSEKLLPSGRSGMGAASIADILIIIGGTQDEDQTPPSLRYSTVNDEWQIFGRLMSQPWKNFAVVSVGSYVYILGGELNGKPSNLTFSYLAIYTLSIPIVK